MRIPKTSHFLGICKFCEFLPWISSFNTYANLQYFVLQQNEFMINFTCWLSNSNVPIQLLVWSKSNKGNHKVHKHYLNAGAIYFQCNGSVRGKPSINASLIFTLASYSWNITSWILKHSSLPSLFFHWQGFVFWAILWSSFVLVDLLGFNFVKGPNSVKILELGA